MPFPCTKSQEPKELTGSEQTQKTEQGGIMKKLVKAFAGELKRSTGTQVDLPTNYIFDLFSKCKELKDAYERCFCAINKDKTTLDQSENRLTQMDYALAGIGPKIEQLNSQILTDNIAKAEKALVTEKVRKELATVQRRMVSHISKYGESSWSTQEMVLMHQERERTVKGMDDLKDDRALLERKLFKVNNDIDATYEDLFEDEQKLDSIKVLIWEAKRDHTDGIEKLKIDAESARDRKRQMLAITGSDPSSMNMSGMYVNPKQLKQMQEELSALREKQNIIEMQIEAQKEEKEFLRSINDAVLDKVKGLEGQVKPEALVPKKDRPVDLKMRQDLSGPKIWFVDPILTADQLKGFLDQRYGKYANMSDIEGASDSSSSDHVVSNTYCADSVVEGPSG